MKKELLKPKYSCGVGTRDVSVLQITNIHHSDVAGFNWRNMPYPYWHCHQHWEILLVVEGKIQHTVNNVTQTATKGYACLLRPNDFHSFTFANEQSETLSFGFSNDVADKLFALYPLEKKLLNSAEPLSFSLQYSTLDAVYSKALSAQFYSKSDYEKYTILIVNRLLLAYNEQQLNTTDAYPQWLNSFLSLVKNPKYLRLPVVELAKFTPYSYSHFSMLFKEHTGKTVISYLNELKLMRAKELLRNTNYTVGEIALDLNYESISSLNHNFKRFTGLTPSEFRKSSSDF